MNTIALPSLPRPWPMARGGPVPTRRWTESDTRPSPCAPTPRVSPGRGPLSRGLEIAQDLWQFWDPFRGLQNMEVAMKERSPRQPARSLFDPAVTVWADWDEPIRDRVVEACAQLLAQVSRHRGRRQKEIVHER